MLSEKIRNLRFNRGFSQVDLAKILGVTKQSVSNWENENIMPSIDILIKLAQLFSVSPEALHPLRPQHGFPGGSLLRKEIRLPSG